MFLGNVPSAFLFELRGFLNLVLAHIAIVSQVADIGDVHDLLHLVPVELQRPPQDILKNVGAQIAEVGRAVDRRSTSVQTDPGAAPWGKVLNLPTESVVEPQGHTRYST